MKFIIAAFIFLLALPNAYGQSAPGSDSSCSIFKNLNYKSGRDTIVIKAFYHDVHMAPPRLITKKRPAIYRYHFDSEISFRPVNCSKRYSEPLPDKAWDEKLLNSSTDSTILYLTCVVFDEHFLHTNGDPDCVVISVSVKQP